MRNSVSTMVSQLELLSDADRRTIALVLPALSHLASAFARACARTCA